MELPIIQQEIFPWVMGLVIGLPVLILLLGELIERLRARGILWPKVLPRCATVRCLYWHYCFCYGRC